MYLLNIKHDRQVTSVYANYLLLRENRYYKNDALEIGYTVASRNIPRFLLLPGLYFLPEDYDFILFLESFIRRIQYRIGRRRIDWVSRRAGNSNATLLDYLGH